MRDIEALLQPFVGYLELGMYDDAEKELESFAPELQEHALLHLARLELVMARGHWADGIILGKSSCNRWPEELEFWFKTAYCQHELRYTEDAKDTLLHAPASIRGTALFYYNLACYETQLGNLDAGKRLLNQSCELDKRFRQDALKDPDLQPLWKA
jgi:hypothetical protein